MQKAGISSKTARAIDKAFDELDNSDRALLLRYLGNHIEFQEDTVPA